MKFTRHEKRLFDELAYYTCLGTQYPYEKQTRMLRLIGLAIGIKRDYFPGEKLQHDIKLYRSAYIREYNILKQENPGLTVETFAESIKVFLAAQEKQRTQQEKRETEQRLAELKQKYDL